MPGPTEALILAGGLGTRLRSAVPDWPKPMAPVNGRPFLEILMGYWQGQGIGRFGLPADGSPALINAGCCLLRTEAARQSLAGFPAAFSLENDWLAPLAQQGQVAASVQSAEFIDIGVPEDYRRFCACDAGQGRNLASR